LVEGQVVASRIGFALNDSLYLYFSGYHPRMSKYSVMTTCTAEAIKWAIQKGFKTINLSPGRDQSKLRWRPTEVPLIEAQWQSPSWRGPALHRISRTIKEVAGAAASPGGLGSLVRMVRRRQ
jgi:CelD/BcsL family acetyltransferase involved in cellulose biosynthesis